MCASHNLHIRRGISFGPVELECTDDAGAPIDLTGWHVWAEIRRTPETSVVADLSPLISDPTTGVIRIRLNKAATAAIPAGEYGWDLVLETPAGDRMLLIQGRVFVSGVITQPVEP